MRFETVNSADRLQRLDEMIRKLQRRAKKLEKISNKYWTVRRVIFVCGTLLALFFCGYSGTTTGVVLAATFVTVFLLVTLYHRRVQDSLTRNSLMLSIKHVQVARLRLDWDHMPHPVQSVESAQCSVTDGRDTTASAETSPETSHPFDTDLDITGGRSLHRLLDSAVTMEGNQRLKSWLLNKKPDSLVIEKRQALVEELKEHSLFRDRLQLLSAVASKAAASPRRDQPAQWNSSILVAWIAQGVARDSLLPTVTLLVILAALNLSLIVLAAFEFIPHVWPILFLVYVFVMIAKQGRIATAWEELQELEKALSRFKAVFQYLERRGYKNTPRLGEVCAPFLDRRRRPSDEVRKLERLAAALGLRTNALLWLVVHAFLPWDFFFTHRLEQIKKELADLLPRWLDAWYELEALNSLANFAYLNPQYVFPEILSSSPLEPGDKLVEDTSRFSARALCHPLLKPDVKVCNDFEFDDEQRIVILTGSNMAGKSTFLRTVGVNLCLAYAGAPVNAERLEVSLFRIFTCIKVSDSVQDGLSYFYAEVKRLKALLAATELTTGMPGQLPIMFLIDEIFRGTNSRERLIGSRAYIRALSERRTFGLVATHDLELVKLAEEIPGVANFHFREEVLDGEMVFDYRLRPGPCPTTNALVIMRLEGLPVEE